jgi:phage-related protein
VTNPIDVAYVDIVVRDKSLDRLEKDIDKSFNKIDKNIGDDLKSIDDKFDELFEKIDKRFVDLEKSTDAVFEEIIDSTNHLTHRMETDFSDADRSIRRSIKNIGNNIDDVGEDVERRVLHPLRRGFAKLTDIVTETGRAIGQIGSGIGGFITSSPLLALVLALIPAIIALAAALSQLIGLVGVLPAGLGVLVAAIVPAVVAFQNFGEAVSALAEGDIEKIDEALKKLSPSARLVAREVAALLPVLKQFQRGVQEAFFSQVRGSFSLLAGILPVISKSFETIAASLGKFFTEFAKFASSANAVATLNALFTTTAGIIDRLSGPFIRLLDTITRTTAAGLPFVDRLVNALGRALDAFSAFVNRSIESGAFNEFVEDAIRTVKELLGLIKAIGGLLGTIFAGTEESGHDFIVTLTDLTIRLDDFFKTADGQQALRDLVLLVKALGASLGATLTTLVLFTKLFHASLRGLGQIGTGFVDLIEKIGDFFGTVPDKLRQLGAFLESIPGLIGQAIARAIDVAFTTIGTQIGLLLFAIQVLPGKIIDFFASLPSRIGDAVAGTGPTLLDIFKKALDDAQAFIVQKFDEIVAFIFSVPDRIVALGPVFLQAGKNLITSFMNGFRSVGSFIGDIAGDIVSSVKSFLNRAIDKINSGIKTIDDLLPGSLARIPHLAKGAVVGHRAGGTLAVVGEGGEDEVVSPISTLEDIIKKFFGGDAPGSGMTVNFGPGSISVSFAGALPTEEQARGAGRAVGDGIVSQLTARGVRVQLRAV